MSTDNVIRGDPVNIKSTLELGATDALGAEKWIEGMKSKHMQSRTMQIRSKVHGKGIKVRVIRGEVRRKR